LDEGIANAKKKEKWQAFGYCDIWLLLVRIPFVVTCSRNRDHKAMHPEARWGESVVYAVIVDRVCVRA
jgi:hypothetical protein